MNSIKEHEIGSGYEFVNALKDAASIAGSIHLKLFTNPHDRRNRCTLKVKSVCSASGVQIVWRIGGVKVTMEEARGALAIHLAVKHS